MARQPAVAGRFYPALREQLSQDLENMLTERENKLDAMGAICPHAGYMFSGQVAGDVYSSIEPRETYVIISPNHTGMGGRFSLSAEPWSTPLGTVEIDTKLLSRIKSGSDLFREDELAHVSEHSIEVQLPFIQKISPEARIVPLTVSHGRFSELCEASHAIAEAVGSSISSVMIIASSDMTHYESRREASEKDKVAIQNILDLDPEGLIDSVQRLDISMCGYIPAAMMLLAVKELGARGARLIKYTDSGEMTGDDFEVVGYAGIVVY